MIVGLRIIRLSVILLSFNKMYGKSKITLDVNGSQSYKLRVGS
ncbi:hypothetical protein PLAN_100661 [Planktothrix rubescens CCAP 1459/22]|uniref:Uncharacterized protein n=1 Tax=Planktothrix rubescens CCAP 1459/22 TaxID=329571 RepID=A0A6J7ZHZ0_PLARU|nr:hypothetical protein PLAN_100661 [Planktothrix rubescens NIVA-CYA 18]